MSVLRSKKKHGYVHISRDTLSQQDIIAVDTFLKSLRKLSKGVTNIQNTLAAELRLIEQIHYKNRNQHGIALFWRNLTEVRRYTRSIEANRLSVLIDHTRSSFFLSNDGNPIAWKTAPWRQLPEHRFLEDLLSQIKRQHVIYSKATEAYRKAYISFSRFSNSTSFLPLAVTLLGITARFHVLAMDIDNESALLWGEIHKLLQTIEQSHQTCKCKPPVSISTLEPLEDPATHSNDVQMLEPDQTDMGEVISRSEISLPNLSAGDIMRDHITPPNNITDVVEIEEDVIPHIAITDVTRSSQVTSQATVSRDTRKESKRKSHKSKTKQRDEIDLIFG